MSDMSNILEKLLIAPKKVRQAALLAAETSLNGDHDVLLVTQAQAARMLSCSRFTIRRLVMDDALHPVNFRGLVRYRCSELRALTRGVPEKEGDASSNTQLHPKEDKDG